MSTAAERAEDVVALWKESSDRGEAVTPDDLVGLHPDLADEIRLRLGLLDLLDRAMREESPAPAPVLDPEFRILREIGRGGMGVVYEAEQVSMRRIVAVKVLYPAVTSRPKAVERFRREAQAAGRLHHTNIVPVHGLGEAQGVCFYVMERIHGRPLSDVIGDLRRLGTRGGDPASETAPTALTSTCRGRSWYRRVAEAFAGLAEALEHAHAQGVLHRDVKPANVLLDRDGTLKLTDFGLARTEGDLAPLTVTGDLVGTPAYMSPEQAKPGRRSLDGRTDVYSLGATLYEFLTLRPPHEGATFHEVFARVLTKDPVSVRRLDPRVPKALETIVLACMEKDVGGRYGRAGDLARDLRLFAAGETPRARRAGPLSRALRSVRRHPARYAVAALLSLGAAATIVMTSRARDSDDARRVAEYRLLLQRAVVQPPPDRQEGRSWAEAFYQQAIALAPERYEAYEARAFMGGGALAERLADVDLALARGMRPARASLLKAYLFATNDRDREAEEAIASAGSPSVAEEPLAGLVAAARASTTGDKGSAEVHLQQALSRLPVDSLLRHAALSNLLTLHLDLGEHAKALADVHALRTLGDDRLRLRSVECWLWRRLDRAADADAAAEALTERALEHRNDAFVVATEWLVLRADDWVERLTERATGKFPEDGDLWGAHAQVSTRRYRFDVALAAWERATALGPECGFFTARQAWTLMLAGRSADALAASERACRLSPDDDEVWPTRADVCRQTGALEEAERAARRGLGITPHRDHAERALAAVHIARGRLAEAEGLLVRLVARTPRDATNRMYLGRLRLQQGRWQDALGEVDAALELARDDAELLRMRGEALRKLDRPKDAADALRRSVALRPRDVQTLYLLGRLLHSKLGLHAEAAEVLRRLLAIDAKRADAWHALGGALKSMRDAEKSLEAYGKARALDPRNIVYLSDEGSQLLEVKRPAEALALLEQALEQDPNDVISRYNKALALSDLGRKEDALREYEEVARRDPTDGTALAEAAKILSETGQHQRAIDAYAKAVAAQPKNVVLRHGQALTCLVAKRFPEAEAAAREALALAPGDAECLNMLGRALSRRGKIEEAVPHLQAAWRSMPDRLRYGTELAAAHLMLDRQALAVDVLRDALQRFPDERWLHAQMAFALADAADPAVRDATKAVIHGRRAVEAPGAGAFEWFCLGCALYRADRLAEAIKGLEKARALAPDRVDPAASYYLAMALHGSGSTPDARAAFDRAELLRGAEEHQDAQTRRHAEEAAQVLGLSPAPGK